MKTVSIFLALALLSAQALIGTPSAVADPIQIVCDEPRQHSSKRAHRQLMQASIAESLQEVSQIDIEVPGGLTIHFVDLETDDLYYDAEKNEILVSYQFLPSLRYQLRQVDRDTAGRQRTLNALRFTQVALFLEFAHAMFDKIDFVPEGSGQHEAIAFMIASIMEWDKRHDVDTFELLDLFIRVAENADRRPEDSPTRSFWTKRGLVPRAPYPEFCLVIGSNPAKYSDLAQGAGYSAEMIAQCRQRYQSNPSNWLRQLQPHIKPGSKLASDI